jgi:hypothetical protein
MRTLHLLPYLLACLVFFPAASAEAGAPPKAGRYLGRLKVTVNHFDSGITTATSRVRARLTANSETSFRLDVLNSPVPRLNAIGTQRLRDQLTMLIDAKGVGTADYNGNAGTVATTGSSIVVTIVEGNEDFGSTTYQLRLARTGN